MASSFGSKSLLLLGRKTGSIAEDFLWFVVVIIIIVGYIYIFLFLVVFKMFSSVATNIATKSQVINNNNS